MTVRIPQHSPENTLNDISCFLLDIDAFFLVDEWEFEVEWCMCDGTNELSKGEWEHTQVSNEDFRRVYRSTYQTIDGKFVLLSEGRCVATLEVFDSSFWDITSSPEFESYMLSKYGPYKFNA